MDYVSVVGRRQSIVKPRRLAKSYYDWRFSEHIHRF